MSGNHTILIIAAMVLTSILMINSTKHMSESTDRTYEASAILTAVSLGEEYIKEIASKNFDENCIDVEPEDSTGFSSTIGHEPSEQYSTFDDIDDYDGYTKIISNDYIGTYSLTSIVEYVNSNNLDQKSYSRTRTKRITVLVSSDNLLDTLKLNYYSAY